MALYIRRQLKLVVSETQQGTDPLVSRGGNEEVISGVAALSKATSEKITVPAPSTDLALTMGSGITAGRGFYIESDQDLTIKFNGSGNTGYVLKVPTAGKVARWYMDLQFTSVHVTLGGTTAANVLYAVIGA